MASETELPSLRKKKDTRTETHIFPFSKGSFSLDLGKTLGNLMIIALLLILASRMVAFAGGEELASPVAVVSSDSMEPTMNVGDMVFWSPTTIGSIEENDIIVFRSRTHEEELVTHRVIEIREENGEKQLITQGDNNEDPDPSPVTESELLGEVVSVRGSPFTLPQIGHIWLSLTTTLGIILANTGGPEMLMGIPLVTAVLMIILILVLSPDEDDDSELADLILKTNEEKTNYLYIFGVLLIAFSLVILPTLAYGSETKEISIGVGEEAEPGDETFSYVRPGQEIRGNQTVSNQGAISSKLYIRADGNAGSWTRFEERYVEVERRSDERVGYTIYVPENAEQGQYTAEIQNHNSAYWGMYPDGFIMNVMDTYPEHGPSLIAVLTILLLTTLSLATIMILSFLFKELIMWRRYRNARKKIYRDERSPYLKRLKTLTDWLTDIGRIDFDLVLPLKAGAISLVVLPLALLGVGLWILPLVVVVSVLLTMHLGGRWRGEIHTAALFSSAVTIGAVYLLPLSLNVPRTLHGGLPLLLLGLSTSIFILLLLSPLVLLLSHFTALVLKRYSHISPDITDI